MRRGSGRITQKGWTKNGAQCNMGFGRITKIYLHFSCLTRLTRRKNEFCGGRGKKRAKFWAVQGKGGPGEGRSRKRAVQGKDGPGEGTVPGRTVQTKP